VVADQRVGSREREGDRDGGERDRSEGTEAPDPGSRLDQDPFAGDEVIVVRAWIGV
jgi:hypothetical protein